MKVDEMERLLAAYYEGTTDEHEENRLKEALRTQDEIGRAAGRERGCRYG